MTNPLLEININMHFYRLLNRSDQSKLSNLDIRDIFCDTNTLFNKEVNIHKSEALKLTLTLVEYQNWKIRI